MSTPPQDPVSAEALDISAALKAARDRFWALHDRLKNYLAMCVLNEANMAGADVSQQDLTDILTDTWIKGLNALQSAAGFRSPAPAGAANANFKAYLGAIARSIFHDRVRARARNAHWEFDDARDSARARRAAWAEPTPDDLTGSLAAFEAALERLEQTAGRRVAELAGAATGPRGSHLQSRLSRLCELVTQVRADLRKCEGA